MLRSRYQADRPPPEPGRSIERDRGHHSVSSVKGEAVSAEAGFGGLYDRENRGGSDRRVHGRSAPPQ
jgi:hypothetical protein